MRRFLLFIPLVLFFLQSCTDNQQLDDANETKIDRRSEDAWLIDFANYLKSQQEGQSSTNTYSIEETLSGIAQLQNRVNVVKHDNSAKILRKFALNLNPSSSTWELDLFNQVHSILQLELEKSEVHSFASFGSSIYVDEQEQQQLIFSALTNDISESALDIYNDECDIEQVSAMASNCMVFCEEEYPLGVGGQGDNFPFPGSGDGCEEECGEVCPDCPPRWAYEEIENHLNTNLPQCDCPTGQTLVGYADVRCIEVPIYVDELVCDVDGQACTCWGSPQLNCFYCQVLESLEDEIKSFYPNDHCIMSVDIWTTFSPSGNSNPAVFPVMDMCHGKPICEGEPIPYSDLIHVLTAWP